MFRTLDQAQHVLPDVVVEIDGHAVRCREGSSVAAVLFANGIAACRETAVSRAPRGPYCMMGICYDCLVVIDGQDNRQGCMTPVRQGMKIERQLGPRKVRA